MSIHDDIMMQMQFLQGPKKCNAAVVLDTLSPDDKDALTFAKKSGLMSVRALYQVVNKNGVAVGETAFKEHMAERCSCDRS